MPWRCPVGSAAQSEATAFQHGAAPASSSAPGSPALIFKMLAVAANCSLTRCHVGSACAPWRSAEAKSLARRSTQRRWTFPAGEPNRFSELGWHAENSWTFCWALAGCCDSGDPAQQLPTISELATLLGQDATEQARSTTRHLPPLRRGFANWSHRRFAPFPAAQQLPAPLRSRSELLRSSAPNAAMRYNLTYVPKVSTVNGFPVWCESDCMYRKRL